VRTLPFQIIRHIEQLIDQLPVEDLVLILSQASGARFLLVYNGDPPPAPSDAPWEALPLSELIDHPASMASFDGPAVGFPALAIMLPDLPTHGVQFTPIDRLLCQRRQLDLLQRTSYRLARTLATFLGNLDAGARAQSWNPGRAWLAQLALPSMLAGRPLENLVALSSSGELDDLLNAQAWTWIYNSPIHPDDIAGAAIDRSVCGVLAALDEMLLFRPDLRDAEIVIDLRVALRQIGAVPALRRTCRGLALRCWQSWELSGERVFHDTAYTLATESWLANEDVEDLVALIAHQDFSRFSELGDALRIYRVPIPDTPAAPPDRRAYSIEELCAWPEAASSYTMPLSFSALDSVLKGISPRGPLDLGLVLWKAGHTAELARTFWLFSRDLLERPVPQLDKEDEQTALGPSVWARINAAPEAITDLAVRSALIYGLSDPWQWRQGRYHIFLRSCYQHVQDCLLSQARHGDSGAPAHYYQALSMWYGCMTAEDQILSLSEIVRNCKAYQEHRRPGMGQDLRATTADRLIEIGERLLYPEREIETHYHEPIDPAIHPLPVSSYLRVIVGRQSLPIEPSPLFEQHFRAYCTLHQEWLRVWNTIQISRPALGDLEQLIDTYGRLRRTIHAPAHERAILERVINEDIELIGRLVRAGRTEPLIKLMLRNPWVTLDRQERLIFRVENIGGSDADQFSLRLDVSSGFDFLSTSEPLTLGSLAAGTRRRIEYAIRAKERKLQLAIVWSYRDRLGQTISGKELFRPEIHEPQAALTRPRGNPYEVGRPVSGSTRFFGRRAELEKILARLSRGSTQPILLRGPRRMGKTSLMNQLGEVLRDRDLRQQLDLQPDVDLRLGTVLPVAASLQLSDPQVQHYNTFFLQAIITDICAALSVRQPPDLSADPARWRIPARVFLKHVDWVLSQRPGARLLILIDEWDEIYREEFRELGNNLRHIVQSEQRLSWIFTSTWTLSSEIGRFGSPWFNILDRIELTAMDWQSATHLVTKPSTGAGVEWGGEAVVAVLELTGRRPYLMQLLCSRIIDYLIQQRKNVVDTDTVETVIDQIIADSQVTEQHLGFLWSDASWMGQLILWALDRAAPSVLTHRDIRHAIEAEYRGRTGDMPSRAWYYDVLDDQLTWLTLVADAVELADMHYSFSFPLVQRWLHRVIRQRKDQIDRAFDRLRLAPPA
jgi:hypothetical protein